MAALRVAIVGPGALGRALGGVLERGGAEVTYIGRPFDSALAPLALRSGRTEESAPPALATQESAPPALATQGSAAPDLAIVTVKAYDTVAALRAAAPLLGRTAPVLTLQNGLGNVEAIAAAVGPERTFGGATTHAARRRPDGGFEHVASGETRIAPFLPAALPRAHELARALSAHGLETTVEDDLPRLLWRKLAVSCGVNALTAIHRYRNGELLSDRDALSQAIHAAEEALAVARDLGIAGLAPADAPALVTEVLARTEQNRSSMLQDIEAGRPTEVDAINGAVERAARERLGGGREARVNAALVRLVRLAEMEERAHAHA